MAIDPPELARLLRDSAVLVAAAGVKVSSDYRPDGRLVKLRPSIAGTKFGLLPMVGPDGAPWWADGHACWADKVLDPASRALAQDRHKIVKDPLPVDAFWPSSPRVKLTFVGHVNVQGTDALAYKSADNIVVRLVADYTRPPKHLFASVRARHEPFLFEGETDDVSDRRVGRFRPHESMKNDALVDDPDPAKAMMLVIPLVPKREDVEGQFVALKLMAKEDMKTEEGHQDQEQHENEKVQGEEYAKFATHRVIKVREHKMENLKKTFKKLEKLAAKLGVKPPTMKVLKEIDIPVYNPETGEPIRGYVDHGFEVEIEVPEVIKTPGNFDVLAYLEQMEPGKNLVHVFTKDDPNLDEGARGIDMKCDHCGKVRRRKGVFVVENKENGERKNIGSQCLDTYTGHPGMEALCSSAADYSKTFGSISDDDDPMADVERGSNVAPKTETLHALEMAAAVIRTLGYVPKSKAGLDKVSTADEVKEALANEFGARRKPGQTKDVKITVPTDEDKALAKDAMEWGKTFNAISDYDKNIQMIAGLTSVKVDKLGFLVSIIPAFQRSGDNVRRQQEREKQKDEVAGKPTIKVDPYLPGNEKDHVTFIAKLVNTQVWQGDYGTTFFYKFEDADNRVITWKASGEATMGVPQPDFEEKRQARVEQVEKTAADQVTPIGNTETFEEARKQLLRREDLHYMPQHERSKADLLKFVNGPVEDMPADVKKWIMDSLRTRLNTPDEKLGVMTQHLENDPESFAAAYKKPMAHPKGRPVTRAELSADLQKTPMPDDVRAWMDDLLKKEPYTRQVERGFNKSLLGDKTAKWDEMVPFTEDLFIKHTLLPNLKDDSLPNRNYRYDLPSRDSPIQLPGNPITVPELLSQVKSGNPSPEAQYLIDKYNDWDYARENIDSPGHKSFYPEYKDLESKLGFVRKNFEALWSGTPESTGTASREVTIEDQKKELALPEDQMPWDIKEIIKRAIGAQKLWAKDELLEQLKLPPVEKKKGKGKKTKEVFAAAKKPKAEKEPTEKTMDPRIQFWVEQNHSMHREPVGVTKGKTYEVTGTIKKKQVYKDIPQTELTRCAFLREVPAGTEGSKTTARFVASKLDDLVNEGMVMAIRPDTKKLLEDQVDSVWLWLGKAGPSISRIDDDDLYKQYSAEFGHFENWLNTLGALNKPKVKKLVAAFQDFLWRLVSMIEGTDHVDDDLIKEALRYDQPLPKEIK